MTYKFYISSVEFDAPQEEQESLSEHFRGVWLQLAHGPKGAELEIRKRMTREAGYKCKGFDFAVDVL